MIRAARALHRIGPGRVPGEVDRAEISQDQTVVQGWVGLPGRRAVAIVVSVDGDVVATCATDHLQRNRSAEIGGRTNQRWAVAIPRDRVRAGVWHITAVAVFDGGLTEDLHPLTVTVAEPPLGAGFVDEPRAGDVLRAPIALVAGWLLPDAGYDHVEVRLGDGSCHRARVMAVARSDVSAHATEPGAPLAGFEVLVDVPDVSAPTWSQVAVDAVGRNGRLALARARVEVHPPGARPVKDPARLHVLTARVEALISDASGGASPAGDRHHLLVATHHLGLGGGQLYLQVLLRHLLKREDLVCTILAMVDGDLRAELELWGARVHIVGQIPTEGLAYEARMLELASLVAGTDVHWVMANTGGAFWGVDLANRLGVPSIWAIHESFSLEKFLIAGFGGVDDHVRTRHLAAVAGAAALVFEADATSHLYETAARPGRCIRIDYGVDLERIAAVRATRDRQAVRDHLGVPPEATLLLCLGTYEPRKAQGALALAFARVAAAHPRATLALVGDQPTIYAAAVHEVVDRLNLGARIRLEPITPDIDDWYLAADGFILGSDVESLPRSMLEVMAYGVPVLGSAVFGIPELLTDGQTGLLFEPSSLAALETVLDRFLSMSDDERRSIGEAGRALVESTRAAHSYGEAYSALLDALLLDPEVLPATVLGRP